MKKCLVCEREIVSKRKDTKYCKDSACRKKAHLARKQAAPVAAPASPGHKASVVLSFPDGSRWLLLLSPLQTPSEAGLPSLAQVSPASLQNSSGSVPAASAAPQISSEQIPKPPALRTVELFFVDDRDRRLPFRDAVEERGRDGWRVKYHARATLAFHRYDGFGLGGSPGRWQDFYPQQSPAEFGLDADVAVLYAGEQADRAHVAEPGLLKDVLGAEWRARLRVFCEDKTRRR